MRIVVNDIAASTGGALTVLESFHRYVRDSGRDHEWVFLLGSDILAESENIRTVVLPDVKSSWARRLHFDLLSGRQLIRSLDPDVVLSLQNTYTYGVGCPQVVYVHQSLPFQKVKNFSLWRRHERSLAIYQHLIGAIIRQSIRRADHVIVQTKWVRDAIIEQVGVDGERVTVARPSLDEISVPKQDVAADPGAFFYPTANAVYKNNGCVEDACQLLSERGVQDFKVDMTIDGSAAPNVRSIGRIPREEVLSRLSRSTLIFPSLTETYGLPLAEARCLGSLILAADLPYAREVLDGYPNAYFFDPKAPAHLACLMSRVIDGRIAVTRLRHEQRHQWGPATSTWCDVVGSLLAVAAERDERRDS